MNRPRPTTRAFTLTELLVVMGIILITIVVGLPSLKALFTAGRVDSAAESISGTVAAARAFATRDKGFLIGEYSGVAVIFTPANELRLAENFEDAAKNNGDKLEELNPSQSGYEDIANTQFVPLPSTVGVVGIARGGSGSGDIRLFPPPFAVRFNQHGSLISGVVVSDENAASRANVVYYDGDRGGSINYNRDRTKEPDVSAWDPTSPSWSGSNYSDTEGYLLPFEAYEAVIGVIIFDKEEWRAAGNSWADADGDGLTGAAKTWVEANGIPLFFNRYTGRVNK